MGKAETKIEDTVSAYARSMNFIANKYTTPGKRGAPDRIYIGYEIVFWIEYKTPSGVLSSDQKREIKDIRDHGGTVFVVDDIVKGKRIIDKMKQVAVSIMANNLRNL